jgi:hypothetical protein
LFCLSLRFRLVFFWLVESDVLVRHSVGRESFYTVKDDVKVASLLILYKTSFVDRLIDNALITLLETRFIESEVI